MCVGLVCGCERVVCYIIAMTVRQYCSYENLTCLACGDIFQLLIKYDRLDAEGVYVLSGMHCVKVWY